MADEAATGAAAAKLPLPLEAYVDGVRQADRAVLGRAITLIESRHPEHRRQAHALLDALLPHTGNAVRLGLSGVPGAGKSTFIENFGLRLLDDGHRVAVLSIDPSSRVSGGSILGDKTRMAKLAVADGAFIRPSPAGRTLGGVASRTREAMLICEAAGFDVVLVETVGVGQSETVVADMVDVFLVLMLTGAGDDLQGIKRGIMEVADMLAVNKADGDNAPRARAAANELRQALKILRAADAAPPQVLTCSGLTGDGLPQVWAAVEAFVRDGQASGALQRKRRTQRLAWLWSAIEDEFRLALQDNDRLRPLVTKLEAEVEAGTRTPTAAAAEILRALTPGASETEVGDAWKRMA